MIARQKCRAYSLRKLRPEKWMTKSGLALCALLPAANVHAEENVQLKEITVKGEALDAGQGAFTVNVIERDEIHDQHLEQPLRLIEQVPGVDLGAYRQGGVADVFTIRGFTGGGHGSDAGVSLDGITLNQGESHSDGYADTNLIIPLELERMNIYKGPVSALYGNFARGGVLEFHTRKRGDYQNFNISLGSFNTFDAQAAAGGEFGNLATNVAVQSYDTEGWRDNSRYTKANMSGRFGYSLSDKAEIALSLRSHAGQWEAPGYIPESQFLDDDRRRKQSDNSENDGGNKRFFAQRVDLNYLINDQTKLLLFAYSTQNDFTRFAKFGYTDDAQQTERNYLRNVLATGASLNGVNQLAGKPLNWVAGGEGYHEKTDWKRWNSTDRVRTAQTEDRLFSITTLSAYAQADWAFSSAFRPVLGLRYDRFSGGYDNSDPGAATGHQDMNEYSHISPKLGLRSSIMDGIELRASASNGFALPDGEAKYNDSLNVDTVNYWQYEVGMTITAHSDFFIDAAYFILDSSDEIMEVPAGSDNFKNIGETRRSGLEAELRYFTPIPDLELSLITSMFDSEVLNNPENTAIEGNKISGLPETISTATLQYKPDTGWGGKISLRSIGESYLNDTNTETYKGYNVVNAGLFYNARFDRGRTLRWYLDVNNATNEEYAEAVWYSASADETNYAPAPPISVTTGIAFNY